MKRLNLRGDTIVEVMMVLAVLGLSFAISYATANRGLIQSRNAQEHSEALSILNSQIERMRTAVAAGTFNPATLTNSICFNDPDSNTPQNSLTSGSTVSASPRTDNLVVGISGYKPECNKDVYYYLSASPTNNAIIFRARWDGLGNLGRQQEEITYRIDKIAAAATASFIPGETTPPPPPPAITTISLPWSVNGRNFTSCQPAEPVYPSAALPDVYNGCLLPDNPASNYVYARRNVAITYKPSDAIANSGAAKLVINYQQYAGAGTTPPAGFTSFLLNVSLIGDTRQDYANFALPVNTPSTTAKDAALTINLPTHVTSVQITWTNNAGVDPDLQINKLTITP